MCRHALCRHGRRQIGRTRSLAWGHPGGRGEQCALVEATGLRHNRWRQGGWRHLGEDGASSVMLHGVAGHKGHTHAAHLRVHPAKRGREHQGEQRECHRWPHPRPRRRTAARLQRRGRGRQGRRGPLDLFLRAISVGGSRRWPNERSRQEQSEQPKPNTGGQRCTLPSLLCGTSSLLTSLGRRRRRQLDPRSANPHGMMAAADRVASAAAAWSLKSRVRNRAQVCNPAEFHRPEFRQTTPQGMSLSTLVSCG